MIKVEVTCDRCHMKIPKAEWSRLRLGAEVKSRNKMKQPLDICERCLEELVLVPLGICPPDLFSKAPEPINGGTSHPLERTASDPGPGRD